MSENMKENKFILVFTLAVFLTLILLPITFAIDNSTEINEIEQDTTNDEIISTNNEDKNIILENSETDEENNTIYVSVEGDDNNPGSSESPVSSISKSIELANQRNSSSTKILIREGTYTEHDLKISSKLEISSQGNVTINGDKKDVILSIDTLDEVKITGLTFMNAYGGAIIIKDAKVTIDSCYFVNNTSDYGGAIYWNADYGTLVNSYFTQNRARIGSAVLWGSNDEDNINKKGDYGLIINTTFENNDNANTGAGCMGLAIYADNVKVLNSNFINNRGKYRSTGGTIYVYGENILINNCLFENNTMSQAPAIQSEGNNVTITNCNFYNNTINSTALDTARGGAIEIQSVTAHIYNNRFKYNGGDECYNGGAIVVIYNNPVRTGLINITKNVFIGNTAVYGAGIFLDGGYESYCEMEGIINQNIFDSNEASTAAGIYLRYVNIEESLIFCNNNQFINLTANSASSIFIDYAIANLSNNTIINCTSLDKNNHIFNNEGYITGNLTVTVNNNNTVELYAGKFIDVNATVTDDMNNSISGGIIRFIVESKDVDEEGFSLESGIASVRFYSTEVGIYNVEADYTNGDRGVIKTSRIVALPYDIYINFSNLTGLCDEEVSVPVQVSVNGYLVDDENVTISFNNKTFNLTVINGIANITLILPENNGTYSLNVTYDIKTVSNYILVKDNHVILSVPNVTTIPNSGNLNISLTDREGNPLSFENITVNISGNVNIFETDLNGNVVIPLNLTIGKYNVSAYYKGNKYKPSNVNSTISVAYINVVLTSSDVKMKYNDGTSYIVRLTDEKYSPIPDQSILISINGKSTVVQTDANGIATLLLNMNPKTYLIQAKYAGNNVYNSKSITNTVTITSSAKLTGMNIKMYFTDKKYYKVCLFGDDGKPIGAGKIVKITVNGKTKNVKTDKNGYASMKISLKPKTYTVKATYGNLKVSNKIVVKKILFTKNISKKKAKTIKFQAKLAKGKKALANKKIKFKIKSKTYSSKTNKKGVATLRLKNLKTGKYVIYTYYSTLKIKNTIKIKK